MIVPKLLSFITIAACLCQSIGAMQTYHITKGGVPSVRTQLNTIADFKHPFPNYAGRQFSGPEGIPSANHLKTYPHEAFPENEDLQKLAAQQALRINYDSLKPLSIRPTSGWSEYAEIYKKLKGSDKDNLEDWLETNVIKGSRSKAMFSERINWYLLSSDATMRWAETHLKDANLITNEDIDLSRISEILQLPIRQQRGLKFAYRDPKTTADQLHEVFFNPNQPPSQTLRLSLLEQIHDNKGTSLYKESMTTLANQLWRMIPNTSGGQPTKRTFMEVLFSAYGEAPVNARTYARTALENMRENPALWTQLPHGTWDEVKASLQLLK
jgi:hypothetical protein